MTEKMSDDQAALLRTVAEKRPDPTDPDAWPDVRAIPGRLLPVFDLLRSETETARLRGGAVDRMIVLRDAVAEAREALIQLHNLSPLETWRLLHVPKHDPLDGVYDCLSPDCPTTGFASADSRVEHYRRWGLPL